ncbi:MAG: ABC transporter permease [Campylobacterales bacterium]|nr:ABC transporter permease [Campylobacterales bacterium]
MTYLNITHNDNQTVIDSINHWNIYHLKAIEKELKTLLKNLDNKPIIWNMSAIESFDSAGVILFRNYYLALKQSHSIEVRGYSDKQKRMYDLLELHSEESTIKIKQPNIFYRIGKEVADSIDESKRFLEFLGQTTLAFLTSLRSPEHIRFKEMSYYIHISGINALPIIALTAFLVGLVIAYQSAVQLSKFGADIFIADMIGISITRELAPMITAIVIAGRSGSSYTAQIGAMKITEEISAMKTMGFDPYYFLVLPRIFALMIAMPLLIFFADIIGIFGGMVVANLELGISYEQFIHRLQVALSPTHYLIGILKAPFFALIIAVISTFRGFQVSSNTESIGHYTTKSVVNSIFFVIMCDALFSIFFTGLGI